MSKAPPGDFVINQYNTPHITNMNTDLDKLLNEPVDQLTQRVAVSWDEDGAEDAGFIIVGKDSEQFQAVTAAQRQRAIRRQALKRTRFDLKTEEGAEQLDDTLQKNNLEVACAVVVDWFGFKQAGKEAPFNKDHVRQILERRPSWRDRLLQALEDEAAFLRSSPATSSATQKPLRVAGGSAKTA